MRLAFVALVVVIAGCGTSSGNLHGARSAIEFQYRMDVTRIAHLRTVYGTAITHSVFCLIPVDDENRYSIAMAALTEAARMKPNQTLANIREDTVTTVLLVTCSTRLTLSADVVEVTPATTMPMPAPAATPTGTPR